MAKAWQNLNLEGGGLQAVNAALTRRLRSPTRTFLAWLGFPLGLHRFYLGERRTGLAYLALTAIIIVLVSFGVHFWWLLPTVAMLAAALWDLTQLETLRAQYNKNLRMQLFLRKGERPPANYRGRYRDTPDHPTPDQDRAIRDPAARNLAAPDLAGTDLAGMDGASGNPAGRDRSAGDRAARDLAEYTALKERERAGHLASAFASAIESPQQSNPTLQGNPSAHRVPSFNEQEALLRAMRPRNKTQEPQ